MDSEYHYSREGSFNRLQCQESYTLALNSSSQEDTSRRSSINSLLCTEHKVSLSSIPILCLEIQSISLHYIKIISILSSQDTYILSHLFPSSHCTTNFCTHSLLITHTCYMPFPSHPNKKCKIFSHSVTCRLI